MRAMTDHRDHLALARGDDPYDSEVARKAAALDLLSPEDQAIAERRVLVQRGAVLGKTQREMAAQCGVTTATIAKDLEAIKAANQRRFKATTPRELAAQFEAGYDYVLQRTVAIAEAAREQGSVEIPDEADIETRVAFMRCKENAETREMDALKLVSSTLKNKLDALAKCGLVAETVEDTEEARKREANRAQLGEQAKDILLKALMANLSAPSAPVQVALTVEHKDLSDADDTNERPEAADPTAGE